MCFLVSVTYECHVSYIWRQMAIILGTGIATTTLGTWDAPLRQRARTAVRKAYTRRLSEAMRKPIRRTLKALPPVVLMLLFLPGCPDGGGSSGGQNQGSASTGASDNTVSIATLPLGAPSGGSDTTGGDVTNLIGPNADSFSGGSDPQVDGRAGTQDGGTGGPEALAPEPATITLVLSGLVGIAALRRQRKSRA